MREVKEEIGLDVDLSNVRCNFTFNFEDGFDDIYLLNIDNLDLTKLKLQKTEVSEVKWATCDEIIEMMKNDLFIPYYDSYIKMLFELRYSKDMYAE